MLSRVRRHNEYRCSVGVQLNSLYLDNEVKNSYEYTKSSLRRRTHSVTQSMIPVKVKVHAFEHVQHMITGGRPARVFSCRSSCLYPSTRINIDGPTKSRPRRIETQPPQYRRTMAPIGVRTYPDRPSRLLNLNRSFMPQKKM